MCLEFLGLVPTYYNSAAEVNGVAGGLHTIRLYLIVHRCEKI